MIESSHTDPLLDEIMDAGAHGRNSREFEMARLYASGKTLQEIGDAFELTRERVRQLINERTPWTSREITAARRRATDRRVKALKEAVLEWSSANPGSPVLAGAQELGVSEDDVRRALGRRIRFHELEKPRKGGRGRSEEELLDDLRRFHAETGETTAAAYSNWARREGVPGAQTIGIRFGSWNRGASLAGIKSEAPIERDRRHSDEDLWAAIVEGVQLGHFTAREFDDWLAEVPGAPSLALLRQRLGGNWISLRQQALAVVAGQSNRSAQWVADISEPRDWASFLDEQDPLEYMKEARLALGRNIRMARYIEWAKANRRPMPSTLMRLSGQSWSAMVEAVGGVPVRKEKRISDEELLAWLRAFLESSHNASFSQYESWRERTGAPNSGTITTRFGGWEAAIERARTS